MYIQYTAEEWCMMFSLFSFQFAKYITYSWTFGEAPCRLLHYLQSVAVICSILTLTAMSLERQATPFVNK